MRVLIDTNIILDFLMQRTGADAARDVFRLAEERKQFEFVSSTAITDIFYLVNKSLLMRGDGSEKRYSKKEASFEAQEYVNLLLDFIRVLPTTEQDIRFALSLRWEDFEDAVQYSVAVSNMLDYIVTNDKKGFKKSKIPVMTPTEFLHSM